MEACLLRNSARVARGLSPRCRWISRFANTGKRNPAAAMRVKNFGVDIDAVPVW